MDDAMEIVFSDDCRTELHALPKEHRAWIAGRIAQLAEKGWNAATADRSIAPLRDGISELRMTGHGAAYRILFFVVPGRSPRLIVLTLCLAKSRSQKRRVLQAAIERARTRRERWLQESKRNDRTSQREEQR